MSLFKIIVSGQILEYFYKKHPQGCFFIRLVIIANLTIWILCIAVKLKYQI